MKSKKFTALLLVFTMMFICTSCATITMTVTIPDSFFGSSNGVSTSESPVVPTPSADTSTPAPNATDNTQSEPNDSTPADTAPSAPASSDAQPNTGASSDKAEIIKYYCDAYNKIASESKGCTRIYDYTSNYNNILNINGNSTLEKLANTLMNKFMVESTDPVAGTASDLPPVGITTLNIPEDKISDAIRVDNGTTYEITLKSTGTDSNYELDVNPGEGSTGLIGPLLKTEDVSGAASGFLTFEGLHAKYATASVKATVDKASGHITKLEYLTPCVLHFDQVKVTLIKVQNCDIGLLFQQTWTVEY